MAKLLLLLLVTTLGISAAQNICCMAMTPPCLACSQGVSVEEFCRAHPSHLGCPPAACCKALTPSCMACTEGISEAEFCARHPDNLGCPIIEPVPGCCEADTAMCLSCAQGVSEERYCQLHPMTTGCDIITLYSTQELARMCLGLLILALGLLWGFFERRRRRTGAEHPTRVGEYMTGLFECFRHPRLCIPACLFTPILAAFNRAEADDRECTFCDVCFAAIKPVAQYTTRQSIRGKFQLASDDRDVCAACCCTPCAVGQDALELECRAAHVAPASLPTGLVAPGVPMYAMPPTAPTATAVGVVYSAVDEQSNKEQERLVYDDLKSETNNPQQV